MRGASVGRRSPDSGVRPTINVTPLVDVVLVLLIIFMVVIPQLDQDVQVDLPSIFNADPETRNGEPFKVHVKTRGEYHFHNQVYDLDGLIDVLEAEHAANPVRRLVLRADSTLRYGDTRELQNRLREIGFPGMAFGVNVVDRRDAAGSTGG
ncbi:MAG TPA: biopolymer transporter ExbD [Candidatus Dormibacteraeota bacterium]|nr:biopolymer transporter ExbD [Candidatus Dormibacteraeota bacterium]